MIPSCRTLLLLSSLHLAACAVDDRDDRDDVDTDTPFADDLVIDADLGVAGVAVTFVAADADVVGCAAEGRCSARFGEHAAEIANATVEPAAVVAVVPAGVVSGPACLTVDGVERCVGVDVVAAPVVSAVDVFTDPCTSGRCATRYVSMFSLRGAALPIDAVVEVDDDDTADGPCVLVSSVDDGGTRLEAAMEVSLAPGPHTLRVRAPLQADARSAAIDFVVDDTP
ncbi:MAG TPA: hypothetical protein VGF99_08660 [Myxococcota bacterium]